MSFLFVCLNIINFWRIKIDKFCYRPNIQIINQIKIMETNIINNMSKLSLYSTTNETKYNGLDVYLLQSKSWYTPFLVVDGTEKSIVRSTDAYEYWCIGCRSDHTSYYCKHEIAVREYVSSKLDVLNDNKDK